jgi:hypothetical protein
MTAAAPSGVVTFLLTDVVGSTRRWERTRRGCGWRWPHTTKAVLDLAVEQVLAPALARVSMSFVEVMSRAGIPLEAIMTELMLSGEIRAELPAAAAGGLRRPDALELADQPVRPDVAGGSVRRFRRPRGDARGA